MTSAIIFDLDGTLADTSACIVGAAQHVRRAHNLRPVADKDIRSRIGQALDFMLASLFNIDGQLLEQAVSDYSTEYVRLAAIDERLFEGVTSLLDTLRDAGFKLAVATGKSQNGADRSTTRLGLSPRFDSIHGIVPGTPGKPHPAVLLRAMKALKVSPPDCIMVGDTTFDLDLAHAVGVRTAAVSWGVHSCEELQTRKPAFLATDLASLQKWLLAQRSQATP